MCAHIAHLCNVVSPLNTLPLPPSPQPNTPACLHVQHTSNTITTTKTQDQLCACMSLYVEDQLGGHHFRELLEYVKRAEQAHKRNAVPDGHHIPGG